MNRIIAYLLIVAVFMLIMVGCTKENHVCINGKLYEQDGNVLYPVYGWEKQRECLSVEKMKGE